MLTKLQWSVFVMLLASVDSQCPSVCACLGAHVDCSQRSLTQIPTDLPDWTETLELQNNQLVNISVDAFVQLTRLQKLDLSDNALSSLSRLVLAPLRNLTVLSLRKNQLTAVPLGIESIASLRRLDLRANQIESLSSIDVSRLARIDDVDLSRNGIAEWPTTTANVLVGTVRLRKLDLANNRLEKLRANGFASLSTLRQLRLARNGIDRLHKEAFKGLVLLDTLDLSRNRLKLIESLTFRGLAQLTDLQLDRNGLRTLEDGALWGLDSLQHLSLRNNKLTSIANGWLYGATSLIRFDVSDNDIVSIDPTAWSFCSSLQHLNLSTNRLTSLPAGTFRKLVDLRELYLDHNQLESLNPESFNDLIALEILDLSNNRLSASIEDAVRPFSKYLKRLRILNLSANRLRSIPSRSFHRLGELKRLDLSANELTSVEMDAFQGLRLNELLINTSSLLCDCKLDWFTSWLREWHLDTDVHLVCGHPNQLADANLFDIDPINMTCENSPKPWIAVEPRSIAALVDGSVEFECVASVADELSELNIQWKIIKDGKSRTLYADADSLQINETSINGMRLSSRLIMNQLTRDDSADYQCVVRNRFGTVYSHRATLTINIYPTFVRRPFNVTVPIGHNARLECSAIGDPPPLIRWQKDGGDDFPAARERRMHVMPTDDVFFIVNAKPEDAGIYTCRASNDAGEIQSTAIITVLEKPSFRQPLVDKTVQSGTTVVLSCMADGSPTPRIEWFFNGKNINENDRYSLTAERQLLVIVGVNNADIGEYSCSIVSRLGSATQSARLNVIGESDTAKYGNESTIVSSPLIETHLLLSIIIVIVCIVFISIICIIWCRIKTTKHNDQRHAIIGDYRSVAKDENIIDKHLYKSASLCSHHADMSTIDHSNNYLDTMATQRTHVIDL